MLKISMDKLPELYKELSACGPLYVPVAAAGQVNFALWQADAVTDLETLLTVRSAKDLFFPANEVIAEFTTDKQNITITPMQPMQDDFTVFGVRACDAAALELLDKIFLSEPVDTFYKARREHATIVALACSQPEETCFCAAYGIDTGAPQADVVLHVTDDALLWQSLTAKGEALSQKIAGIMSSADAADEQAAKTQDSACRELLAKLPLGDLKLPKYADKALEKAFDAVTWEGLQVGCLSCGTCTYVCPTCHCYDIKDYDNGQCIQRARCWDSCMCSDFTNMAHGNPRSGKLERFRQRYMHKLIYFPRNNGKYACVGCGRCLNKCPIGMNIVKVLKTLEVQ